MGIIIINEFNLVGYTKGDKLTSTSKKGTQFEKEVIRIFESRGWKMIKRSVRYRFNLIDEFGCFDIVMRRGSTFRNEGLLIQVKGGHASTKEVIKEMTDWYLQYGLTNESAILAVRRKRKDGIFYDVYDLDGAIVERINWSEFKKKGI